jgi:hypothetical protein
VNNAFNIHMPQLVNEHDTFGLEPNTCAENKNLNEHDAFVLEPNTCAKNKNLLPIAVEKDELKLLYSLDTWVILSLILCVILLLWKRNLCLLICLGYLQQYDNFKAYNRYNHVMSRSPRFVIKQ